MELRQILSFVSHRNKIKSKLLWHLVLVCRAWKNDTIFLCNLFSDFMVVLWVEQASLQLCLLFSGWVTSNGELFQLQVLYSRPYRKLVEIVQLSSTSLSTHVNSHQKGMTSYLTFSLEPTSRRQVLSRNTMFSQINYLSST